MSTIPSLDRIKIFADGASLPSMLESARDPAHRRASRPTRR